MLSLVVVSFLLLGTCGGTGCPKCPEWISSGPTSEASRGLQLYEHSVENMAVDVIGQDRSSDVVALFLKDWELGRVALNCHLSMDLLCQEMRDAYWGSSDSHGSLCSLCLECQVLWWKSERTGCLGSQPSQQIKPSLTVDGAVTFLGEERGEIQKK